MKTSDETVRRQAVEQLDRAAAGLDAATLRRLRQARTRALEAPRQQRHWGPALALAMSLVLALGLWLHGRQAVLPETGLQDLEVLGAGEGLDFYEDLDFYQWLVVSHETG